ncbi:MAG: hypothetical protein GY715_07030 [Planctomycetes bacterium]|nr:hypothetical protein [Planctomycetota bacterium]
MNEEDTPETTPDVASRRSFLARSAKKAAYLTPVVMAVGAQQAHAGLSVCGQTGSPCFGQNDCCGGWSCVNGMGAMVMMGMMGTCQET